MVVESLPKFCVTKPDFLRKTFLAPKIWEKGQKYAKNSFLKLKKNLVINFPRICSIMKIYVIFCVPGQLLYWEKSYFWDIGQNALSQLECRIFKSTISPEQIDETDLRFVCWYKFTKSWSKIFWLGMVKYRCS